GEGERGEREADRRGERERDPPHQPPAPPHRFARPRRGARRAAHPVSPFPYGNPHDRTSCVTAPEPPVPPPCTPSGRASTPSWSSPTGLSCVGFVSSHRSSSSEIRSTPIRPARPSRSRKMHSPLPSERSTALCSSVGSTPSS